MKLEKMKHDHKLTEILKVLIFGLLMLAPLIASCSQWIYATLNKNAYQSYSDFNKENTEYKLIGHYEKLKSGNTYKFISNNNNIELVESNIYRVYYTNFNIEITNMDQSTINNINNSNNFSIWRDTNTYIRFYNDNNTLGTYGFNSTSIIFTFIYLNSNFTTNNQIDYYTGNMIYENNIINTTNTLDDSFYYGVKKMTESELFNWTENTALYTGIKTMTDNLGIETNAIAILLTYWMILIIIYLIIDIILKTFTVLTHLLGNKT